MITHDQAQQDPRPSALQFVDVFRAQADALSAELIPLWKIKHTDVPYTAFMKNRAFPATAVALGLHCAVECAYVEASVRNRFLDAGFFYDHKIGHISDALVAIEIENKEPTLSDEIGKLVHLQSRLSVLFFYSTELARERRLNEIQRSVRQWGDSSVSEFLVMWNMPGLPNPHWHPTIITPHGSQNRPRFTIL